MIKATVFLLIGSREFLFKMGGGPRVVVSTAAFHARVRGLVRAGGWG